MSIPTKVKLGFWTTVAMSALTGTTIYFTQRARILPVDMYEIFAGYWERADSTQYALGSNVVHTVTNAVYTWSNDSTPIYWYSNAYVSGSWRLFTNSYKIASRSTEIGLVTSLVGRAWWHDPSIIYNSDGEYAPLNFRHYHIPQRDRYIWGPFAYYDVESSNWPALNGHYVFSRRSSNGVTRTDHYTNLSGVAMTDRGPHYREHVSLFNENADFSVAFGPLSSFYYTSVDSPRYGYFRKADLLLTDYKSERIVTNTGPIITNLFRDAQVYSTQTYSNSFDYIADFDTYWNLSDGIKQLANSSIAFPNSHFLDSSLTNAQGTYNGLSDFVYASVSSVWFAGQIDNYLSLDYAWPDATNYYLNPSNLFSRYDALHELKQTLSTNVAWVYTNAVTSSRYGSWGGPTLSWVAPSTASNRLFGSGNSGASWAAAKSDAESTATETHSDTGPTRWTGGIWQEDFFGPGLDKWSADFDTAESSPVLTDLHTNWGAASIEIFLVAEAYDDGLGIRTPYFSAQGTTLAEGDEVSFYTESVTVSDKTAYTNAVTMGSSTVPTWTTDPADGGIDDKYFYGYRIVDTLYTVDWTPDEACNYFRYEGHSYISYAAAKTMCENNLAEASVSLTGAPMAGTYAEKTTKNGFDYWTCVAEIRFNTLGVTGLSTNRSKQVDFYAKCVPYTYNGNTANKSFSSNSLALSTNWMRFAFSDADVSSAYTSTVSLASSISFPEWPEEPESGSYTQMGFRVSEAAVVCDWEYEHCTTRRE